MYLNAVTQRMGGSLYLNKILHFALCVAICLCHCCVVICVCTWFILCVFMLLGLGLCFSVNHNISQHFLCCGFVCLCVCPVCATLYLSVLRSMLLSLHSDRLDNGTKLQLATGEIGRERQEWRSLEWEVNSEEEIGNFE